MLGWRCSGEGESGNALDLIQLLCTGNSFHSNRIFGHKFCYTLSAESQELGQANTIFSLSNISHMQTFKFLFLLLAGLAIATSSCKKDDDESTDMTKKLVGTYKGTWTESSSTFSFDFENTEVTVTKTTDTTVSFSANTGASTVTFTGNVKSETEVEVPQQTISLSTGSGTVTLSGNSLTVHLIATNLLGEQGETDFTGQRQ
jgi:hypothetical protein